MMNVLNMGSMNIDYVYEVDHIVVPGETQSSRKMKVYCGGKGLNQSVALARAGVSVAHAGIVGEDGGPLLELCRENGIDTAFVRQIEGKSGHTIIQVDQNAQNSILLYGGSNRKFSEAYVKHVLNNFGPGDVLLLQNEINLLDRIVELAFNRGMDIILNPSPMDAQLSSVDMSKIALFIVNEIEGEQMTGMHEPEAILSRAQQLYPDAGFVLTLGAGGSICQYRGERFYQAACPVKAVDTTAAGDTFTGYLIAGLLESTLPDGSAVDAGRFGDCHGKAARGNSLMEGVVCGVQKALDLASRAAALAVTRPGATPSIPWRNEVI